MKATQYMTTLERSIQRSLRINPLDRALALTIGDFRDEVGNEEGGSCVREIVADEFKLLGHTHDSSKLDWIRSANTINDHMDLTHIEEHFVDKLHRIAAEHNGHYSPIDLAADSWKVDSR